MLVDGDANSLYYTQGVHSSRIESVVLLSHDAMNGVYRLHHLLQAFPPSPPAAPLSKKHWTYQSSLSYYCPILHPYPPTRLLPLIVKMVVQDYSIKHTYRLNYCYSLGQRCRQLLCGHEEIQKYQELIPLRYCPVYYRECSYHRS